MVPVYVSNVVVLSIPQFKGNNSAVVLSMFPSLALIVLSSDLVYNTLS